MLLNKAYYTFKFLVPRWLQIQLRRYIVRRKQLKHADVWPIDHNAGKHPEGWTGWPEGKKFALVLTHDVETAAGLDKCYQLAEIEERLGFRSSFSFVPGDYTVPAALRQGLIDRGFEIGIHGLHHDKNPFRSESIFKKQSIEINRYLKEWDSVGFRSPSMYHDLEMLHHLNIEYDTSTFDTDPFEPQSDGMGTIFPFWVSKKDTKEDAVVKSLPNRHTDGSRYPDVVPMKIGNQGIDKDPEFPRIRSGAGLVKPGMTAEANSDLFQDRQKGYVELPYTLPQDFLLFILMQEKNIDIWKKKLDWITEQGGMALFDTHPDYINFNTRSHYEEYPAQYYEEFLKYIKSRYDGQYWHALPRDVSRFWAKNYGFHAPTPNVPSPTHSTKTTLTPIHVCQLVYSFYESDNRVMRYAETLVKRGDLVDVIALRKDGQPFHEVLRGVNVYRIQGRVKNEKGQLSFLYRLIKFLIVSSIFLAKRHLKKAYQVIHVNNIPDFLVFAALFPKLLGAKVILDVHDIVPELYAEMFNQTKESILFKSLVLAEKVSCTFVDHVIIANHIWYKVITTRSVAENKCSVVLNYPDENVFYKRTSQRQDDKFVMIYPGSLNRRQGVDIAVKAFALIKDKIPGAEFHIYGTGTDEDYLKQLVLDLGLKDRVFLKGNLPIYEVAEKMAAADLGIEPKRNDMFAGDAMSTKILEFMSVGIPVIASDTRVHKYYFDDSVVLFFKSDDEKDLARCMLLLINNADLLRKMKQNCSQFVEGFLWSKRKEEYLNLVDKLTQNS